MRLNRRHPSAGFTVIELLIAVALLAILATKVLLVVEEANESQSRESAAMALEGQAMQVLDQIAYAVMGSSRESLFPDPSSPFFSEELKYEISLGVEDGVVVYGDPERIGPDPDEPEGGRVIWSQNPGAEEERRVVWCNVVRPYLEDELPNGIDDNGNGLIDERGLNFVLDNNKVTIRLTLERQRPGDDPMIETVETEVTIRN